jgi:hypothetical protein
MSLMGRSPRSKSSAAASVARRVFLTTKNTKEVRARQRAQMGWPGRANNQPYWQSSGLLACFKVMLALDPVPAAVRRLSRFLWPPAAWQLASFSPAQPWPDATRVGRASLGRQARKTPQITALQRVGKDVKMPLMNQEDSLTAGNRWSIFPKRDDRQVGLITC